MTPEELDERIEHMAHQIARAYGQQAPFMAISPFIKQLIRDCIEAVTPDRHTEKEESDEQYNTWNSGRNNAIDTIEQNTKELLK